MAALNASGDCGDQNSSSISAVGGSGSVELMAKCILLAALFAVVLLGNALMLQDAYSAGQPRKWSASLWLLKVCID